MQHFDWADNCLFVDQIPSARDPSRTAFFFGAKDIIIDASRARKYLEKRRRTLSNENLTIDGLGANIRWDEEAGHGDGLSGDSLDRVINYIATGSIQGWSTR